MDDQIQSQLQNLSFINPGDLMGTLPSNYIPPVCTPIPPNGKKTASAINPKTGQEWKHYCWTCGCCPHWGKNCPNKKKGHKNEATFKNRMGGSNQNYR